MNFKCQIFTLGLSFISLLGFQSQAMDLNSSPEEQVSETKKRPHTPIESRLPRSHKKQKLNDFTPFRSKDRDKQINKLTKRSPFVEGEECARLRWVESLETFSGGKKPNKSASIPADIHGELTYVGNHLRAFAEKYPADSRFRFQRNILIPHVSFVVKRNIDDHCKKLFITGSYINFDEKNYPDWAMAFISGGDSMPWTALKQYNSYKSQHNAMKGKTYDLPFIRVLSGKEVERIIGKKLPSAEHSNQIECLYHTEEMFYEMLLANPNVIVAQAEKVLLPIDEIVHVVFDFYSWWDVCRPCQKRFRTEYFNGTVHQKLEEEFDNAGFSFSKDAGILPLFRVSSYKQHHSDSLINMTNAGGGSKIEDGFEAKVVSQAQVVLSTRKITGEYNYPAIFQKIRVG
jgi:hypothetical protein